MDVVHPRCRGLDVHKRSGVACAPVAGAPGRPRREVRPCGTLTDELLALADWLATEGVTHVAMEATGSYGKPIRNLPEGRFDLLLANARHIKAVPGRKTDARDAEWIADRLRHGVLRPGAVPDRAQRELRELARSRTSLVRERAAEAGRLQKTPEGANLERGDVASEVLGRSARAMPERIVAGAADPAALAELVLGRLREKIPPLERALAGRVAAHQRFLPAQQLAHPDYSDAAIAHVSAEVAERLRPRAAAIERPGSIPGVGRRTAETPPAEIGPDRGRFPTAGHPASRAGLCPGRGQSAGKRRGGRTRTGTPWLRQALVEAAQAAGRTKGTDPGVQYRRPAARRGKKKAVIGVGHPIPVTAYRPLAREQDYAHLGPDSFERRDRAALGRRSIRRREALGYRVTPEPPAPASPAA